MDCKRASHKEIALGDRDTSQPRRRACLQPPASPGCTRPPEIIDTRETQLPATDKYPSPISDILSSPRPLPRHPTALPGHPPKSAADDMRFRSRIRFSPSAELESDLVFRAPPHPQPELSQPPLLFFACTRRLHRSLPPASPSLSALLHLSCLPSAAPYPYPRRMYTHLSTETPATTDVETQRHQHPSTKLSPRTAARRRPLRPVATPLPPATSSSCQCQSHTLRVLLSPERSYTDIDIVARPNFTRALGFLAHAPRSEACPPAFPLALARINPQSVVNAT